MNLRERMSWRMSGVTAKMVVEDYDDTSDAILNPLIYTGAAWTMAYTTGQLVSVGGLLATGTAAIIGPFGLAFTFLAPASAVASYEYATESAQDGLTEVSA
ncbi:hypothetical protein [Halolamina sp.]|uniref:hypothetical protein n=1 Tax=Halolamina sp. TaxID=1940283 RepID=UPI00356789FF